MDQPLHSPDEMAGYVGFLMHRRRVESSDSLLQHFGFQEDPFRVSPDPRYMYPSRTHLEALASLENGFYNNRGFIAMIAPPGMGKTTLLYRFLEDTRETARSVFLFDIDPAEAMLSSDKAALPQVGTTVIGGTPYITLTYRQKPQASGITVNVQTSTDLQSWKTVTPDFTQTVGTDSITKDPIIEVEVKTTSPAREFIRLNVTSP